MASLSYLNREELMVGTSMLLMSGVGISASLYVDRNYYGRDWLQEALDGTGTLDRWSADRAAVLAATGIGVTSVLQAMFTANMLGGIR